MDIRKTEGRKWQITINNPEDKGIRFEEIKKIIENKYKNIKYYCYSYEIGIETKTPHIHIFLWVKNPIKGSSLLKLFEGCHLELVSGTAEENRDYIFKTEAYFERKPEMKHKEDTKVEGMQYESGEIPKEAPGKRTDIEILKDLIVSGKTNAEIYEHNASYLRYANSIDKMRLDLLADKFGKEWRDVEVTYICGVTGTGKTRGIMDTYGYENVYRISKDDYSFSTYTAQDVVVFEEFRNTFQLQDMLNLLDGYPIQGRAMHGFRQLGYTKVFICSNWDLRYQYENIQQKYPEDWQAFLRRINKVIVKGYEKEDIFYQKNRGTKINPQYDFISDIGISYFDPFDQKIWGEDADACDAWEVTDMVGVDSWEDL